MSIATISSKGQITLPAEARRQLGIHPHDPVVVELEKDAIMIRPAPDIFKYKGVLGKALPREKEREEMMKAVAAHVLGEE